MTALVRASFVVVASIPLAIGGCRKSPKPIAATDASPPEPPPPPATWKHVTFQTEDPETHRAVHVIDVFPDGRVVFHGGMRGVPSVARARNGLLVAIERWAKEPLPPEDADAGAKPVYVVRVRVERDTTRESVYPSDHVPQAVDAILRPTEALINAPRTPETCTKWDGKGDFTLSLQSQDFGIAAGPISRITIRSDGTASLFTASGAVNAQLAVAKTTTASGPELDAIRAAVVAQDLGHYGDVFEGAGEGSNYRSVELTTTTSGDCARAFTNEYPRAMKPLLDAVAPVRARL